MVQFFTIAIYQFYSWSSSNSQSTIFMCKIRSNCNFWWTIFKKV